MANDIQGIGNRPATALRGVGEREGQGRPGPGETQADDRVSITDTAVNLGNIERTMAQIPVVDGNRVESAREALAEGTYSVDAERTAERFIQLEMQLPG